VWSGLVTPATQHSLNLTMSSLTQMIQKFRDGPKPEFEPQGLGAPIPCLYRPPDLEGVVMGPADFGPAIGKILKFSFLLFLDLKRFKLSNLNLKKFKHKNTSDKKCSNIQNVDI
jgi:hypothetical protein